MLGTHARSGFTRCATLVAAVAVTLTAAATSSAAGVTSAAAAPTRPGQAVATHGGHLGAAALQAPDPVETRITLERLLGNHATLTARFMRARMQSGVDLFETAEQAIVANTEEMRAAIGSVLGDGAADEFEPLWASHVEALGDYARAVSDEDDAGREEALAALADFRRRYGAFIASATGGSIAAPDAEANIGAHLDHLTGHVDAYAGGDHVAAFGLQRQAYAHMFPVAGTLAGGIGSPGGELPVAVDPLPQQVRSRLGMLLGEHFELVVEAMRSGVTGSDDFDGVAEALNGNTRDLTAALDGLFGAEVASAFAQTWAGHTELLMRYTAAFVDEDEAERRSVLGELEALRGRLATTFSELTGGALPVATVATTLTAHDGQLLDQLAAYAEEDYATAYDISFEGYHHMFDVAAALAPAIETRLLALLPQGGPQTGGGGTAGRPTVGAAPAGGWWAV